MLRIALLACNLLVATVMAQSAPVGREPSPLEAFATATGAHAVRSEETGRLESGVSEAVVSAVSFENGGEKMSGVMIDLSRGSEHDQIYLDEEAAQRTIRAMDEIIQTAVRMGFRSNGCAGAREFWPLYSWPWNKYHELNVDFCGGNELVLSPRGRDQRFTFSGKEPSDLAAMLTGALGQLKQH